MKALLRYLIAALCCLLVPALRAGDYEPLSFGSVATPDAMFIAVENVGQNLIALFGVLILLAILVTGFFLGRKWLGKVG